MRCILGLDDTDSQFGHCTTHLGYMMVARLIEQGSRIVGYPRLVRLNPNIPFKTRGNAAVAIEFSCDNIDGIFEEAVSLVEQGSQVEHGANSGLVLLEDMTKLPFFASVYERALCDMVNKDGVIKALAQRHVKVFTLGNGMGAVGAAASIGFEAQRDHTYELLAYRRPENWGKAREVDKGSVREMDRQTFPQTFNNYDYQRDRVLLAPHGPDPVFLGIRGDSPEILLEAFGRLKYSEELEGRIIFTSNQGTDAHLENELETPLKAYASGWATGRVLSLSRGAGGHLYISLETRRDTLNCAVYEPTGDLLRAARLLMPGDGIGVAGGVRRATSLHEATINIERLEVFSPAPSLKEKNPTCGACRRRMKSEGRGQGFLCRKCGRQAPSKVIHRTKRDLVKGIYLPSPRAHRHLTKPLIRYGRENKGEVRPLVPGWFSEPSARLSPVHVPSRRSGPRRPQGRPRP